MEGAWQAVSEGPGGGVVDGQKLVLLIEFTIFKILFSKNSL